LFDEAPALAADDERRLAKAVRCRPCDFVLAAAADALVRDDAHAHTFVNPLGEVFTILLYARADGVVCRGVPQGKTSWFAGTAWRFAHCGHCRRQVGWHYAGAADFFGLIADRVVVA
jgi:hypothetical protein